MAPGLDFSANFYFSGAWCRRDDLVAALEEVTLFRFVDPRFATVEKAVLERVSRMRPPLSTAFCP